MFCSNCGKKIDDNAAFCSDCGTPTGQPSQSVTKTAVQEDSQPQVTYVYETISKKTRISYVYSIIGAVISFVVRIVFQSEHIYWDNLLDNVEVLGIDREAKPFVTFIPAITAVIAILLLVSDKETSKHIKNKAYVVNGIFIVLALLFIWLDIPYEIFDF